MKIGTAIRNMGPAAKRDIILSSAQMAEKASLEHIWAVDHVAIPPDESEGSDGIWLDPLAVLSFFAAATSEIKIGVSVLVLPYRPPLLTAKWVASIQELSNERLLLGVGPGWMEAEYKVLGVEKRKRGKLTDEVLDFLRTCFNSKNDVVNLNGQDFYFRPKPKCPPVYVGGMTEAALRRVVERGEGWMPVGLDPVKIKPLAAQLKVLSERAEKPIPKIMVLGSLPDDNSKALDDLLECQELGVTDYIQASRYSRIEEFENIVARLTELKSQTDDSSIV